MPNNRTNRPTIVAIILLFQLALALPAAAQKAKKEAKKEVAEVTGTPVLWREPTDIETRNLLLGAGGEEMKPDLSSVTFVEIQTGGHSTKYRVRDGAGKEWIAKVGQEAQSEIAANRLVWAVGYESEITYLIPHLRIEGKGEFDNVRLEARPREVKRSGEWKWESNPFSGTPQFQGLKIMMLLINNWDIKDSNNEVLLPRENREGEARYIISDLGGTLGKTGGAISRSRNKPSDFVKAGFIERVKGDRIEFNYKGKSKKLFDDITVADARWLSRWLGRLSDDQIKDAFRAANYGPEEVEELSRAVRERIDALAKVSGQLTARP
jgi:hypothetical protein